MDYFLHSGDTATLAGWGPLVEKKFATSTAFWAAPRHQSFCGSDDRIGADFENSPPSEAEKTRYYKMLSIQAAREYARAVALCGAACPATMRNTAAQLGVEFATYFEKERPLLGLTYGMHAAAGAVLTGLTTAAEEQQSYEALLSNPAHICSFAPFNTYFILDAVSRLRLAGGRQQTMRAALSMIRRCFHGMNRMGATTYWETFSPEWETLLSTGAPTPNSQTGYMSHCHPWASGAAPWLTHAVAGLQPIAAGWTNFSVTPFLDPLSPNFLSSIRATQPISGGRHIMAAFACNGSGTLTVPTKTTAGIVGIPLCGADGTRARVTVNGKPVSVAQGDDCLVIRNLGPGNYVFNVQLDKVAGTTAPGISVAAATMHELPLATAPDPVPSYRDRFIGADYSTGGSWRTDGGYGAAGHLLWSWHQTTVDNKQLPAFVSSVIVNCPYTGVSGVAAAPNWVSPTAAVCSTDRRALQPDASGSSGGGNDVACSGLGARTCGTVATVDFMPSSEQGVGPLNISAYFVDWERHGRRFAVELREYENLQLAAPTQYLSNFTEGVYLTWEVKKLPVRLRLMQVAGPLPNNNLLLAFSAVFFGQSSGLNGQLDVL